MGQVQILDAVIAEKLSGSSVTTATIDIVDFLMLVLPIIDSLVREAVHEQSTKNISIFCNLAERVFISKSDSLLHSLFPSRPYTTTTIYEWILVSFMINRTLCLRKPVSFQGIG